MQRYRYKHGDQPLEGYTIQRAAGRGGFGEVYYALSDSGREVALKAVQNYENIELRGIKQCMNLKNPHLVTIFDVKYNDRGQPFVIMEYVSGPSLRMLLAESPGGLGTQKAAYFLREIAKGLSYLHSCGIVHRDLKPGNIFYENGYVKVGDYGLTKAISASRHSGQTITVGTVHYMAPEIGAGKYNYGIDIYALGVLLYEMLTGDVPFLGESPAEILMKHMTSEPEMKNIDEPFAHVIRKALAKDPDERYQSVQEMVEDLYGSENIRNSVSQFSPEELSIVAKHAAEKAKIGSIETPAVKPNQTPRDFVERIDTVGRNVAERVDTQINKILGSNKARVPGITDPVTPGQRHILSIVSAAVIAIGATVLRGGGVIMVFVTFVMINVCAKTILYSHNRWFKNLEPQSRWISRLMTSFLAAFLTSLIIVIPRPFGMAWGSNLQSILIPLLIPLFLVNWQRHISSQRPRRISLGAAIWIGLLGLIITEIVGSDPVLIAAVLAGTSLVVQTSSSYGVSTAINRKKQPVKIKSGVSPYKRTWALLLSAGMFFGFNGLQRFYVGKIGTGILWFFTWGLLGIGQIIDIILILTGNFKDRYGRPLLIWHDQEEVKKEVTDYTKAAPAGNINIVKAEKIETPRQVEAVVPDTHPQPASKISSSSIFGENFHPFAFLCSGLGFVLFVIAILLGLALALRLPHFVAAGWPEEELASDFEEFFGYSEWPGLAMRLGSIAMICVLVLGSIFTVLGRIYKGRNHWLRAFIGIACLIGSVCFFSDALHFNYNNINFNNFLSNGQFGPALDTLLQRIEGDLAFIGMLSFLASVIILAWPAKRKQREVIN